jgi:hypothetical protein
MKRVGAIGLSLALVLLGVIPPQLAFAATPVNDDFASATVIPSLPFTDTVDNTAATRETGEPAACNYTTQTVWYTITPASNGVLNADTVGSSFFDGNLAVFVQTGAGFAGLSYVACAAFPASVTFAVQSGVTYYLQASSIFSGGGSLTVNVAPVPPPSNDSFAAATVIASLPFTSSEDVAAATLESDEPLPSCENVPTSGSVWYSFTPSASATYLWTAATNYGQPTTAVYTGSTVNGLTELSCLPLSGIFSGTAGTQYMIQVVGSFQGWGPLFISLDVAPPPRVSWGFSPGDPSIFDVVRFYSSAYDPAFQGISGYAWTFGDGGTSTDSYPTHTFATDGDYTVQLTVTTPDGRSAAAIQTVHVETHDVAITKLSAPKAASAGQTRPITVGLTSKRYPETVAVDLYKSVPGGFQLVSTLTQSVPVRSSNRTTDFAFSYAFTSGDASVGKVTFKAVATILGARDALPADNEAIASPTKMSK